LVVGAERRKAGEAVAEVEDGDAFGGLCVPDYEAPSAEDVCRDELAVWAEGGVSSLDAVVARGGEAPAGEGVPDFDGGLLVVARYDARPVGREARGEDVHVTVAQEQERPAGTGVPDSRHAALLDGQDALPVGTEVGTFDCRVGP
jgi:hypothetical protein